MGFVMRSIFQSVLVLSPFFLSSLFAADNGQTYYLEKQVADQEAEGSVFYSLDKIVGSEDYYADSSSMSQGNGQSMLMPKGNCGSPFHVMHASIRHTEARGIGYRSGYTTIEGFGIYDKNNDFMPFIDLRGHVFNDGKFAGNIGIGERTALFSINHLLGIYFYYDVRQDRHGLTVNQVSPGIELVGSRMEYRLNGYFPVGGTKSHTYGRSFDKFKGHNIIVKRHQREAMTGGDGEIGVHITQSTKYDLYAAAGAYYFDASSDSSWGGKARLVGRYKEYITLEASYSYDHLFHSIVQGTVAFNLPFGARLKNRKKNCGEHRSLWFSRAAFAPQRFEIPVIRRVTHRSKAINPATGKPWQVWFVNNTSSSSGTYESPFPTLVQAQNASSAGDAIYIFPGDGTTKGMDKGIVLKDNQKLFGSGIKQVFPTTHGKLSVSAMSKKYPNITNTSLNINAVELGNSCEVAGLNISNVNGGLGINGGSSLVLGVKNTYVHNNIFTNNGNNSINLANCQGNIIIKNNYIENGLVGVNIYSGNFNLTSSINISNNILLGVGGLVVSSDSPQGSLSAIIQNNVIIKSQDAEAIFFGNFSTNAGGSICGTIIGNQIDLTTHNVAGIRVQSLGSCSILANVSDNTVTNTPPIGVAASSANSSSLNLQLINNTCSNGFSFTQANTSTFNLVSPDGNVGGPVATTGNINVTAGQVSCEGL